MPLYTLDIEVHATSREEAITFARSRLETPEAFTDTIRITRAPPEPTAGPLSHAEVVDAYRAMNRQGRDCPEWQEWLNGERGKRYRADAVEAIHRVLDAKHREEWDGEPLPERHGRGSIVLTAEDDPGEWAPGAVAVVHREGTNLPATYHHGWLDWWAARDKEIQAAGFNLYCECINDAVMAYYPVW